jgi:hypothetical protein
MTAQRKPVALLRLMAERQGQRITARDVASLQLAAATLEAQAAEINRHFRAYGDALSELIDHKSRADALQHGLRALLEIHT